MLILSDPIVFIIVFFIISSTDYSHILTVQILNMMDEAMYECESEPLVGRRFVQEVMVYLAGKNPVKPINEP